MEEMTQVWPTWAQQDEFFRSLSRRIILVHLREILERPQLIVRFNNGYGVSLLLAATAENEEVFEMEVLRFHGPGINDHKLAQYTPVPEFNRDHFEEIIHLCEQVSLLPQSQTARQEGLNQGAGGGRRRSLFPRGLPRSPGRHGPGRCA
jgi:hypothetical protein